MPTARLPEFPTPGQVCPHPETPKPRVLWGCQEGVLPPGLLGDRPTGGRPGVPGHTASFPPLKILAWAQAALSLGGSLPCGAVWAGRNAQRAGASLRGAQHCPHLGSWPPSSASFFPGPDLGIPSIHPGTAWLELESGKQRPRRVREISPHLRDAQAAEGAHSSGSSSLGCRVGRAALSQPGAARGGEGSCGSGATGLPQRPRAWGEDAPAGGSQPQPEPAGI